ncbi:conserved hypothetical protein [uncultured Desulfatiglans sp.]|nr:conserved hypothetical protein [uncultured Desulfatiglans sp.]
MIETGVIHGRFQVLHRDHMRYLMAGKALTRHLVVGITNPDPQQTGFDAADPERSVPSANPLTYFERYILLKHALLAEGLGPKEFSIVPFPINLPELYRYYVPLSATFFLTIYDAWGRRKKERFETLGLKIHVLWEKPPAEKGLSGKAVRARMATGEAWESLVPPATIPLLNDWAVPERLRLAAMRPGEGEE